MKLTELEPQFIKYESGGIIDPRGITLAETQGLWFLCPLCFAQNNGPVGTHACEVSFAGLSAGTKGSVWPLVVKHDGYQDSGTIVIFFSYCESTGYLSTI